MSPISAVQGDIRRRKALKKEDLRWNLLENVVMKAYIIKLEEVGINQIVKCKTVQATDFD